MNVPLLCLLLSPSWAPLVHDPVSDALADVGGARGVVVGLVSDGETHVYGYGRAHDDVDAPPDAHTIYEIGSITKVFTGLLLARDIAAGAVRPDTPVGPLLGQAPGAPPVTLAQLSTHLSGLHRLPADIFGDDAVSAIKAQSQPYADYDRERLFAWFARGPRRTPPGADHFYSNGGVAVLGEALARRRGVPYAQRVRDELLRPLGMTDTHFVTPPEDTPRLADGHGLIFGADHWRFGPARGPWDVGAIAPAGALRSTAADLLRFAEAQWTADGELGETLGAARAIHAGRWRVDSAEMGWGWFHGPYLVGDERLVWHNGGTGGFRSFLGFLPRRRAAIVVLANFPLNVNRLAVDALRAVVGP